MLIEVCGDPMIHEINLYGSEFVKKLCVSGLKPVTIAGHCRRLNEIFTKLSGTKNKKLLPYTPYFQPPKVNLTATPESESALEQLTVPTAPAFQFHSTNELIQFYLKETKRFENSTFATRTSSGTILTIVNPDEELLNNKNNNIPSNGIG
jgi:hypothetical protein